jgi:hypothetical protein
MPHEGLIASQNPRAETKGARNRMQARKMMNEAHATRAAEFAALSRMTRLSLSAGKRRDRDRRQAGRGDLIPDAV